MTECIFASNDDSLSATSNSRHTELRKLPDMTSDNNSLHSSQVEALKQQLEQMRQACAVAEHRAQKAENTAQELQEASVSEKRNNATNYEFGYQQIYAWYYFTAFISFFFLHTCRSVNKQRKHNQAK
jgi:outer membrane murein-binding lipoprotein Lpp